MLTVCCTSTDVDLTTTSALKSLLGTTSTAQDAWLATVIRSASRWAESYVGYPLTAQSYSETLAGYGRRELMVKRTPIRNVDRIMTATTTDDATEITSTEYILEDEDAGLIARNQGFHWTATLESNNFLAATPLEYHPMGGQEYKPWLVDYRAGWTYSGLTTDSPNYSTGNGTTSTGRTLPEDIEQAVLFRAQALYEDADEVASESLGDLAVNYRSLGTDPTSGKQISKAELLLGPYVRFK